MQTMPRINSKKRLHQAFIVGLVLKGLDGILEFASGLVLLIVTPTAINGLAQALTKQELSQDPNDFLANHIVRSAASLGHSGVLFGGLYLLSHGLVKLILVAAVLKQKLWAYPWMIGFILLFMIYQTYRIAVVPTLGLTLLTIFDAIVVVLTWIEYRQQAAKA